MNHKFYKIEMILNKHQLVIKMLTNTLMAYKGSYKMHGIL